MHLSFSYQIRRSQRAKKARIVVSPAKVEVVAPLRMSDRVIKRFIYDKQDWVTQALDSMETRQQSVFSLAPSRYVDGAKIPFQGQYYQLSVSPTKLKRVKIEFSDRFNVLLPQTLHVDSSDVIRAALINWMRKQALSAVNVIVEHHAQRQRLYPRSIRIKTQKSRWGSCGIHNDININWLLMLAPPAVLEYVVVHEICHIQHRNHSADFWALVATHLPAYQAQRVWLKDQGAYLMLGL